MLPKDPQNELHKLKGFQSFEDDDVLAEKAFSALGSLSSPAHITSTFAKLSDTSHITSALSSLSDTSHITSTLAKLSDTSHITSVLDSFSNTSPITSVLESLSNSSHITSILNSISSAAQIKSTLSALADTSRITSAFGAFSSGDQIRSVLDGISGASYRSAIDSISSTAHVHSTLSGISSNAHIRAVIDSVSNAARQSATVETLSKIDSFGRLTASNLSAFAALNRSVVSDLQAYAAPTRTANFIEKQTLDSVFQDAGTTTHKGGLDQSSKAVSNEHLEGLLLVILGNLNKKKKITAMEWYMAVMTLFTIVLTVSAPVWTKAVESWMASKAATPLQIANVHIDERRVLKPLQMRMNAGARSPSVGMVKPGTLVAIIDIQKDWTLIESKDSSGNRIHGWVFSRYLEKVRPRHASTNPE